MSVYALFEDNAGVVSSKTECIGKSSANFSFLSFVESEVHLVVNLVILITLLVVNCRRDDIILYGSDQIWRKQKELGDFNEMYFGSRIIKAKK